ncbi:formate/nitrite transporter family protein [Microvirga rosea]|uniref:formate/nitrite transporter family protein n=1 Tax=Microvirga rosea TaxID=2715425 RepID=UPI001D0B348B|nr:formate/nitrite transporter family protein [Microvirga rosea]MCB8821520.1 formate/nitrite transporter family protein [Microvirga rosea]
MRAPSPERSAKAHQDSFNPAEKIPDLSASEKKAIEEQSRPNAALIHETIRAEGESELDRSVMALLLSGLAAGLSIGFSLVVEGLLHAHLPDTPWKLLISGFGYPVGFLIVVLGRQQLFTENTLTPILPLLHNRDADTFWRVLKLWLIVLAANIAATWIFAAVIAHTPLFAPEIKSAFTEISRKVIEAPFGTTLIKAVFAGWLIALMVWLLPGAETGRAFIILIITYVVAIGGFSHLIAGSVDGFYLVETGQATWADYAMRFFVPTLIGNILGGVTLVAVLNFGQVAPELE